MGFWGFGGVRAIAQKFEERRKGGAFSTEVPIISGITFLRKTMEPTEVKREQRDTNTVRRILNRGPSVLATISEKQWMSRISSSLI